MDLIRPTLGISGIEWIVYDIQNGEVLAVRRNFMMSGQRAFLAAACAKVTWLSQFKESHFYVTNLVIPPKSNPMDYQTPFFETSKASPSEIKR